MDRGMVWLLTAYAFTVPWEYSLEFGEPWGNVARLVGLALLAVAVPAVAARMARGELRRPGWVGGLTLALLLWFGMTLLWTVDMGTSLATVRGFAQELAVVWLLGEFVESGEDWLWVVRAFVAGCGVLAVLTLGNFTSAEALASEQVRFAAEGQDPNDVARFLDLGFGLAGLLVAVERRWAGKALAAAYLPLGVMAAFLTASRGGLVGAAVGLGGALTILLTWKRNARLKMLMTGWGAAMVVGLIVPGGTLERLMTIPEQLQSGDLNQRVNLWIAGMRAFGERPWLGWGAGTFTTAAKLAPYDTAHNTLLSVLVTGGLVGVSLFVAVVMAGAVAVWRTRGLVRIALATTLAVGVVTGMVGTVEENRATWLLLGLAAVAGRVAGEQVEAEERVVGTSGELQAAG